MKRFVVGAERDRPTLFPECLEDWVDENYPVRVIDVFVDNLDMADLCFAGVVPQATGRPSYHPAHGRSATLELVVWFAPGQNSSAPRAAHARELLEYVAPPIPNHSSTRILCPDFESWRR